MQGRGYDVAWWGSGRAGHGVWQQTWPLVFWLPLDSAGGAPLPLARSRNAQLVHINPKHTADQHSEAQTTPYHEPSLPAPLALALP